MVNLFLLKKKNVSEKKITLEILNLLNNCLLEKRGMVNILKIYMEFFPQKWICFWKLNKLLETCISVLQWFKEGIPSMKQKQAKMKNRYKKKLWKN